MIDPSQQPLAKCARNWLATRPVYKIIRPYRRSFYEWVCWATWGIIFYWFLHGGCRAQFDQEDFAEKSLKDLKMPLKPARENMEIGYFLPANVPELVEQAANWHMEKHKRLIGRLYVIYRLNEMMVRDKHFFTYKEFLNRLRFSEGTGTETLPIGHHTELYDPSIQGYVEYLRDYVPDLYDFLITPLPARCPTTALNRHIYELGMSGSGKTELIKLILVHLITNEIGTLFLVEPHGTLSRQIARMPMFKNNDRLVYLSLEVGKDQGLWFCINPFDLPDQSNQTVELHTQALVGAFGVMVSRDSSNAKAFTDQMKTILTYCIPVLLRRARSSFNDLLRMMDNSRNGDLIELALKSKNPQLRNFFKHDFDGSNYSKSRDGLQARLHLVLSNPAFEKLTCGQSTVFIDELLDSGKMVIICASEGTVGPDVAYNFGAFCIALIQSALMRKRTGRNIIEDDLMPVTLAVDEFQNYISPTVLKLLKEFRKFKFRLLAAQQTLGDEASAKTQSIISGNTDFKAIGKYTADNAEQVATKIRSKHITAYELDSIPAGQGIFYFKIGDAVPVKVKVHDHLVLKGREDDYAMSWSDFAGVEQNQRQLYYRKPGDYSSLSATPIKSLVNEIDTVADPEARQEWQPTKSFPKPENDSDRKRKRYYPAFDDLE